MDANAISSSPKTPANAVTIPTKRCVYFQSFLFYGLTGFTCGLRFLCNCHTISVHAVFGIMTGSWNNKLAETLIVLLVNLKNLVHMKLQRHQYLKL